MTTTDKLSCEDLSDCADYALYLADQGDLSEDAAFNAWLDEEAAKADAAERQTPAAF